MAASMGSSLWKPVRVRCGRTQKVRRLGHPHAWNTSYAVLLMLVLLAISCSVNYKNMRMLSPVPSSEFDARTIHDHGSNNTKADALYSSLPNDMSTLPSIPSVESATPTIHDRGSNDTAPTQKKKTTNTNNGSRMPKTLWLYWAQGREHLERLSRNPASKYVLDATCVKANIKMNPTWDVRVLSEENAKALAPTYASLLKNETLYPMLATRMKSNLLRLELLSRYGGVYADTSICPLAQLDAFIDSLVGFEEYGFYAPKLDLARTPRAKLPEYANHCHHPDSRNAKTASSWFLASSTPHNPLVDEWLSIYMHHLLTKKNRNRPYFLVQCSMTEARFRNASVESIWAATMARPDNGGICFGSLSRWSKQSVSLAKIKRTCRLIKKPQLNEILRKYLLSEDYMVDVERIVNGTTS